MPQVVPVPEAGADAARCAPNEKECSGACVAVDDPAFGCAGASCEPCSVQNAKILKCSSDGRCAAATCRPGWGACVSETDGCRFDLTTPETCASCSVSCPAGLLCAQPSGAGAGGCVNDCGALTQCGSSCVDTASTATHCGGCGKVCPTSANGDPLCKNSQCVVECRPGFEHCDGNPAGPCVALAIFYKDGDGDGVGVSGAATKACPGAPPAGHAAVAGDCHDGNANVRPTQQSYIERGYTPATGAGLSFDYNCNGIEEERPGTPHLTACTEDCTGEGFGPVLPVRSGPGVNPYCGSTTYYRCAREGTGGINPKGPPIPIPSGCVVDEAIVAGNPCR